MSTDGIKAELRSRNARLRLRIEAILPRADDAVRQEVTRISLAQKSFDDEVRQLEEINDNPKQRANAVVQANVAPPR